jgi:hypothetical protein
MPLTEKTNNQPPSASAKAQPIKFSPNPPQNTVGAALASGKKQVDAAKK